MRKGTLLIIASLVLATWGHAQWDVPVRIVLDGAEEEDRQIIGLGAPESLDAAVSVDALRSQSMSHASASGAEILIVDLHPPPAQYSVGMTLSIVPTDANFAAAMIDINELGPIPILKWGSMPLDSADLNPGRPARMIFDGTNFQLISSAPKPCPVGYTAMNREYCITDSSMAPNTFYAAVLFCTERNARLCSFNEWSFACRSQPGFLGTVSSMEWVDSAGNNILEAKTVGSGWQDNPAVQTNVIDCNFGDSRNSTSIFPFRCCMFR